MLMLFLILTCKDCFLLFFEEYKIRILRCLIDKNFRFEKKNKKKNQLNW